MVSGPGLTHNRQQILPKLAYVGLSCFPSFIQQFFEILLYAKSVLGPGDIAVNKTHKVPAFMELLF